MNVAILLCSAAENGRYCSFLILVDYTFVLNLDKVASVKH